MVAKQNLTVYQGADFQRVLEFKDESGVLINLTGTSFRGQVRSAYTDTSPVFSFSFTLRDQMANTGLVDMLLAATDTAAVSISKVMEYLYDVEMIDTSSKVRRVVEGKLKLYPEVTK